MHPNFINRLFFIARVTSQGLRIGSKFLPVSIVERLIEEEGVLLWERGGVVKMVLTATLANYLRAYEDAQMQLAHYPPSMRTREAGVIRWEQIPRAVEPQILRDLRLTSPQVEVITDLSKGREETNKFPDPDAAT